MNRTCLKLTVAAVAILGLALMVGTALAQEPPAGREAREGLSTGTPQSGLLWRIRTQQRNMTRTPQPQGTQAQTRTQQRTPTMTPQAQGTLARTRTQQGSPTRTPQAQGTLARTRIQQHAPTCTPQAQGAIVRTRTQQPTLAGAWLRLAMRARTRAR